MPPKAVPIPNDVMETKLASAPLSGQDVRALLRSEAWNGLDSRNAQLTFLDGFARTDCAVPLDSGHLEDIFNLICDCVRKVLAKSKYPSEPRIVR
jgi:hypothetical protein